MYWLDLGLSAEIKGAIQSSRKGTVTRVTGTTLLKQNNNITAASSGALTQIN